VLGHTHGTVAYRDDREALLARTEALAQELARERARSTDAEAEARKLRRDLGVLTRALGRGAALQGPAVAKLLPLIVASLVGAATLIGVNVGRGRPPACHLAASSANRLANAKSNELPKVSGDHPTIRLVPMGMGLVTLDTQPPARVWLDGHTLGLTPLRDALVPSGSHILQLEGADGSRVSRRVEIAEGVTTGLQYFLDADRRRPVDDDAQRAASPFAH
jgi:hypothetical protein